jgi:hypothetical protein
VGGRVVGAVLDALVDQERIFFDDSERVPGLPVIDHAWVAVRVVPVKA